MHVVAENIWLLPLGTDVGKQVTEVNEENNRISLSVRAMLHPKKDKEDADDNGDYASVDVEAVAAAEASEEA